MTHTEAIDIIQKWARAQWSPFPDEREPGKQAEAPDWIGWVSPRFVPVIEVKVSESDWQADRRKPHRSGDTPCLGTHVYVAAPKGVIEPYEAEERGMGFIELDGGEARLIADAPPNHNRAVFEEYALMLWVCRNYAKAAKRDAKEARQSQANRLTKAQAAQVRSAVFDGCESVKEVRQWMRANGETPPSPKRISSAALQGEIEQVTAWEERQRTMLAPATETNPTG